MAVFEKAWFFHWSLVTISSQVDDDQWAEKRSFFTPFELHTSINFLTLSKSLLLQRTTFKLKIPPVFLPFELTMGQIGKLLLFVLLQLELLWESAVVWFSALNLKWLFFQAKVPTLKLCNLTHFFKQQQQKNLSNFGLRKKGVTSFGRAHSSSSRPLEYFMAHFTACICLL